MLYLYVSSTVQKYRPLSDNAAEDGFQPNDEFLQNFNTDEIRFVMEEIGWAVKNAFLGSTRLRHHPGLGGEILQTAYSRRAWLSCKKSQQ